MTISVEDGVNLTTQLENSAPDAISPAGAIGRGQIMPDTAAKWGFSREDMFDPEKNLRAQTSEVTDLINKFNGDRDAVLIGYNAGPGWAEKWLASGRNNAILPGETQRYLAHANSIDGVGSKTTPVTMVSDLFQGARQRAAAQTESLLHLPSPAAPGQPHDNWGSFAQLRASGYSWDDINNALNDARKEALAKGWSNQDFDHAFGLPPRDYPATTPDEKGTITNIWSTLDAGVGMAKRGLNEIGDEIERIKSTNYMQGEGGNVFVAGESYQKKVDQAVEAVKNITQQYIAPSPHPYFPVTMAGLAQAIGWEVTRMPRIIGSTAMNGLAALAEMMDGRPKTRAETVDLAWEAMQGLSTFAGPPGILKGKGATESVAMGRARQLGYSGGAIEGEILPPLPTQTKLLDAATAANIGAARQAEVIEGRMGQPVFKALPKPEVAELPPEALHPPEVREPFGPPYEIPPEQRVRYPAFPALPPARIISEEVMREMQRRGLEPEQIEQTAQRLAEHFSQTGQDPMSTVEEALGNPEKLADLVKRVTPEESIQRAAQSARDRNLEVASSFSEDATKDALKEHGYDVSKPLDIPMEDWRSNAELLAEAAKRLGNDTSGAFRLALNEGLPYPREALPLPIDPNSIRIRNSGLAHQIGDAFLQWLAPHLRSTEAKETALYMREYGTRVALLQSRATQTFQRMGRAIGSLTLNERFDFMHAIQTGELQDFEGTALGTLGKTYREWTDRLFKELKDRDLIDHYRKNYLSQLWRDEERGAQWLQQYHSAYGNRFFQEDRLFETYRAGMEAGLVPRFTNPIQVMLFGIHQMVKTIETHDLLMMLRANDIGRLASDFPEGKVPPEVYAVNPRIAALEGKTLYAPEPVALLFNRYFSCGLEGNAIYNGVQTFQSSLRLFKLALSPFHAGLMVVDTYLTGFGKITAQLSRVPGMAVQGEPLAALREVYEAAKTAVRLPTRPVEMAYKGSQVFRRLQTGLPTPGTSPIDIVMKTAFGGMKDEIADVIGQSGVRLGATHYDYDVPLGSFWRSFAGELQRQEENGYMTTAQEIHEMYLGYKNGGFGDDRVLVPAFKTILNVIPRAMLTLSFGLFERGVPWLKLGNQYDLLADQLRVRPGLNDIDTRRLAVQDMSAVEDRMGELVMNNTFIDKVTTQIGNGAFFAMSFLLGNVRAVAGGLFEYKNMKIGGVAELTPRQSYVIGAAVGLPVLNALYAYMNGTWKPDWSLVDYYVPHDAQGNRVTMPGLEHWALGWLGDPLHQAYNESSIGIHMLKEFLSNMEYNNAYIAHPLQSIGEKTADYAQHLAHQFEPVIFESSGLDPGDWLERNGIIKKAPNSVFPSPRQERYNNRQIRSRGRIPREEDE